MSCDTIIINDAPSIQESINIVDSNNITSNVNVIDNTITNSLSVNQIIYPPDYVNLNTVSLSTGLIEVNYTGGYVVSVNGKVGVVLLTKNDFGLDQVNNTSDSNKPISNATLSSLLLKADLSAFNALNNFISNNHGTWDSTSITVQTRSPYWNNVYSIVSLNSAIWSSTTDTKALNSLSANWNSTYTTVSSLSSNWNTTYNTISTLTYQNVNSNIYGTIQDYAASNPQRINKGSTVRLDNGRVYIFAGTDVTNSAHYIEVNLNPITPIYQEIYTYNQNEAVIDTFSASDFKSAKYTLQIETNFDNNIYYSEINVMASIQSQLAVLSEYGQISTSDIILGYQANYSSPTIQLIILFSSSLLDEGNKIIVKGHRTNFYKI